MLLFGSRYERIVKRRKERIAAGQSVSLPRFQKQTNIARRMHAISRARGSNGRFLGALIDDAFENGNELAVASKAVARTRISNPQALPSSTFHVAALISPDALLLPSVGSISSTTHDHTPIVESRDPLMLRKEFPAFELDPQPLRRYVTPPNSNSLCLNFQVLHELGNNSPVLENEQNCFWHDPHE